MLIIFWYTFKWKSNQMSWMNVSVETNETNDSRGNRAEAPRNPFKVAARKLLFPGTIARSCASIWRQLVMLAWCDSLDNSFLFSVVSGQIDLSPAGCYYAWWTQTVTSAPAHSPPTPLPNATHATTSRASQQTSAAALHSKFPWNHTAPAVFGFCARH